MNAAFRNWLSINILLHGQNPVDALCFTRNDRR